jgi:hypothetical protein
LVTKLDPVSKKDNTKTNKKKPVLSFVRNEKRKEER